MQDFVRSVPDVQVVPWAQPMGDTFHTATYFSSSGLPGATVSSITIESGMTGGVIVTVYAGDVVPLLTVPVGTGSITVNIFAGGSITSTVNPGGSTITTRHF